jgi:hypothetical protein
VRVRHLARLCSVLLSLAGFATPASAHDTWVRPLAVRVLPGQPLTAEMSAGHGLTPLSAPKRRRERALLLLGAGGRRKPRARRRRGKRALADFAPPPSRMVCAVCCIALRTRSVTIEIDDEGVDGYLAEVQPPANILQAWQAQRALGQPWVEHYAKEAKGYLRAGTSRGRGGRPWQGVQRLGHQLEIVPLTDPTRAMPRHLLTVELREGGLVLPDIALRLFDRRGERVVRTDAQGRAALPVRCRGRQLVATTVLQLPAHAGAPWTSRFATLSYTVA